nr:hypothetical protein [Tanacetum cinerariifolium]
QNSKKGFIPMKVKHDLSNEMCASSDEEKACCGIYHVCCQVHKARCGICSKLGQSISTESEEAPLDDTKSQTGYVFVVNGGAVDWKSKNQTTIAMQRNLSAWLRQKLQWKPFGLGCFF